MNRPRRSASTRIQKPAYPTGLFSDEDDPPPSRKRNVPDSDPGSESDFNPGEAAADVNLTESEDSDQIDETASQDEDEDQRGDDVAEDDDDLVIGHPRPAAPLSKKQKANHPSIMLPIHQVADDDLPAPLVLAPVDPSTIQVLSEHRTASETLIERIIQAIVEKKALVDIQSTTSSSTQLLEHDQNINADPAQSTAATLVRMPVIVDGKFGCPICPFSGVTRSAFIGHLKHSIHPVSAVAARLFPKPPLESRSPLLGNLPDVHPLSTTESSILELIMSIPVPLYPLQIPLGTLLLTTDIGEFLYESTIALLGMPEFDPLSYLQLQPVFSRQDTPIYAHLKDLVATSVNGPRSKQSLGVWQGASRVSVSSTSAVNDGDIEELASEATTWAMPKPRRTGKKSLKAAEAAGGPLDPFGPVLHRFESEKHVFSRAMSRRMRHALEQLGAEASCRYQVVESCRADEQVRAGGAVDLLFEGSKEPVHLEALTSAAFDSKGSGYVINTGGSVWGTSWHGNYLVVGGYQNSTDYHVVGKRCPGFGTIQVWDITRESNAAPPELVCCIHHNWGACFDLKWWPGSYHDAEDSPRIGLVGGCFADGSFRLFAVPRVEKSGEHMTLDRVVFEIQRPDSTCLTFDWGGTEKVAIGFSNGFLSMYDVPFMLQGYQHALISHFPAHDSFVGGVSFERGVNPHSPLQLMTCGSDGRFMVWDVRDLSAPLVLNRSRAFLRACEWSKGTHFLHFADTDHSVRSYHNPDVRASQVTLGHSGTIWSMHSSPYHPFVLSASGDGSVKIANPFMSKVRRVKQGMTNVYSMQWDEDAKQFKYTAYMQSKELVAAIMRKESGIVCRLDPRASIQSCAWCDTPEFSGWLASGGRNGVVRIDNVTQTK